MTLTQQICAQARVLIRDMGSENQALLEVLCRSAEVSLTAKLRKGITPEDCKADFIAAASLYALATLDGISETVQVEEFQAGDLTIRQSSDRKAAASSCLQRQADMMIQPYLKDRFTFLGV